MRNDRLLNALGQIDEKYILEAAPQTNKFEKRKKDMKKRVFYKRPLALVATLVLCITVSSVIALAATGVLQGFFQDVFRPDSAVVGTTYEQATNEVEIKAVEVTDNLLIEMTFVYPDKVPYREFEEFGIESYNVVDMNNNVIVKGPATEKAHIENGKVSVSIPLDNISNGNYKLVVSKMVGGKKADQPLVLSGDWVCEFTLDK